MASVESEFIAEMLIGDKLSGGGPGPFEEPILQPLPSEEALTAPTGSLPVHEAIRDWSESNHTVVIHGIRRAELYRLGRLKNSARAEGVRRVINACAQAAMLSAVNYRASQQACIDDGHHE